MDTAFRRVTGTIVGAPLTRRNRRELMYCGFGGLAGLAGFWITLVLLLSGLTISVSVIGTVFGLVLITTTLRVSRRLGSLHRRLLNRLLGRQVEAPPPFQPGAGILNRVDRRLRDRPAWRAIWYALIKLPVSAVQLYAVALTAFGLADLAYPAIWLLFRHHHGGTLSPLVAVVPVPFGGNIRVGSWLGAFPAALAGAACVVAAARCSVTTWSSMSHPSSVTTKRRSIDVASTTTSSSTSTSSSWAIGRVSASLASPWPARCRIGS